MDNEKGERGVIDLESYTEEIDQDLFNKSIPKKDENSYRQGYSFPLRFILLHFFKMVKKLKKVERSGRPIEVNDLPELEDHIKVEYTSAKLKKQIETIDPKTATSLQFFFMLGRTFPKSVSGLLAYIFLENIAKLISPICTATLINAVKDGNLENALYWSLLLIASNFFGVTLGQNGWAKAQRLSAQLRLGLIYILYDKVSNLSAYSVKKANIGKIINMISSDFNSFEQKGVYIFHTLVAPIILTISSVMIFDRLKWTGFLAILLLVSLFPLQKKIAKKAAEYTKRQSKDSDQKIKLFSEMMDGIRIIKMYGWERAFKSSVNKWRNSEVRNNLINQTITYIESSLSQVGPLFIAMLCFLIIDIYDPNYLDTALIFSTIELLNLISLAIMKNVGFGLSFIYDFKVLLDRFMSIIGIENELMQNVHAQHQHDNSKPPSDPDILVDLKDFSAFWHSDNLDQKKPVISNINFQIKKGQTSSVIGQIGSGKTSLLFAIMQEIPRYSGKFYATSSIALAEQEPFILQGSIRDNILFGKDFDESFYTEVVTACCLIDDFKQLSNGDLTVVGERGTNLSGGQKARVSLARAVYADADLYLLDDPLSAVDSKVAKKIFKNVIEEMLKNKGVVLVTHQLNYALKCQNVALFDNGTIVAQGLPNQIDFSSSSISKFIATLNPDQEEQKIKDPTELLLSQYQDEEQEEEEKSNENKLNSILEKKKNLKEPKEKGAELKFIEQKGETLMRNKDKKEEQFTVTLKTYLNYIRTNPGSWKFLVVLLSFICQEFLFTGFYKILSFYQIQLSIEYFYLASLSILSGFFIFKFIQNSTMSYFILTTNEEITSRMVTSISHAKPIVLDEIPAGQIINKFSNDINILDKQLPEACCTSLEGILHFVNLIGTLISINKYFVIPGSVEVFFFYKWFYYIKSVLMRSKQLDLENKTPVFQFFQSSMNGILIINVFKQKQKFANRMAILMNNSIRTYDIFWFISRIFSVYMQYMALIASSVGIFMTLYLSSTDYGEFGQALAFFLLLTNFLHISLRGIINMDNFMTSTERAFSILNLEKEAVDLKYEKNYDKIIETQNSTPAVTESYKKLDDEQIPTNPNNKNHSIIELTNQNSQILPNSWPHKGEIIFDNVYMKYKEELGHVLKGVSFRANPLERVGIVGRTGAGKSSILQGLFRMSEIDNSSPQGKSQIIYDQVNIKDVPLSKLRKCISIIPQTPFVFSGSIKKNIDPLGEFTDDNINRVLAETGLNEIIKQLQEGINSDMSDSQSVFSMGQKQLVCLARVMLRNNKVIVLDEATANVDMETDLMIQELIKQKFSNCTVITIAHRLNTIADYDKVIVLDDGKVVEQGAPFKLLALSDNDTEITNNSSAFAQMVLHTGPKNSEEIFKVSKAKYLDKN